jgi:hypothetical protein
VAAFEVITDTNTQQQVDATHYIGTSATVDDIGRPKTTTDGNGKTTGYQYADSFGDSKTTVTPPAGPQVVTDDNASLGYVQSQQEKGRNTVNLTAIAAGYHA